MAAYRSLGFNYSSAKTRGHPSIQPKSKNSNKYIAFYNDNCRSLDAKTFSEIKNKVIAFFDDEDCPPDVKIMFGEWLFKKIYMNFKMYGSSKDKVRGSLEGAVADCKNTITKGQYLQLHDMEVVKDMALNFYLEPFDDGEKFFVLQMLNDVELVKQCIRHPKTTDDELLKHFKEWLTNTPVYEQKSNLLDVLLEYFPRDQGVKDLYQNLRFEGKKQGNIYQDAQNVHDSSIQKSVMGVAVVLLDDYERALSEGSAQIIAPKDTDFRSFAVGLLYKLCVDEEDQEICNCVIERMCIDTTTFSKGGRTFTISEVFLATLNAIFSHESKDEMCKIFMEEMKMMAKLCASGYVSRFINTLQGFYEKYEVTISFEKQLYAVLSHKLHGYLKEAPEEVILGTFDEEYQENYLDFVQKKVNGLVASLNKEYGYDDVRLFLAQVAEKLTSFSGWNIGENNLLSRGGS